MLAEEVIPDTLEYQNEVMLRPPSAACASSRAVLCAETVKLAMVYDDYDDLESSSDPPTYFDVYLFGVSQIIRERANVHSNRELSAVLEADYSE